VSSPAEAVGTARLRATRDGRLEAYALAALAGFGGALAAGQPALAALGVPFALALALGLRRTGPVEVRAVLALDAGQVLEGDPVTGRITVEWDGDLAADVMLHGLEGVEPAGPEPLSWSFPRGTRRIEVPIELRATQWGRHVVGEVWVRLHARFGLLSWMGKVVPSPFLRVLPREERLNRLLNPFDSRAVWGMHLSRRIGHGHEFAELRPYVPGDRLRDLNWKATARHGRPFVNRYHPELAGEVVLVLDAFGDGSASSTRALVRAARVAWALISVHLRANDRVGLAGIGGSTQWLPPGGGRLARYRLLETLLRIGGEAAAGRAVPSGFHRLPVPSAALVVALSPLEDQASLDVLTAWRARGRSVVVAWIDTSDLFRPASEAEALAVRVWRVEVALRRRALADAGVPVVEAPVDAPAARIVPALRRARRAPAVRRAR
jgi:uncharacterized protein (DUF58 family)